MQISERQRERHRRARRLRAFVTLLLKARLGRRQLPNVERAEALDQRLVRRALELAQRRATIVGGVEPEHTQPLVEGSPWLRGGVTGLMTTAGGIGHTLPFLISNFRVAMLVAVIIVAVELGVISYIRHRYMDTPFLQAAFQVIVGGVLVFLTGWLIGSA